MWVRYSEHINSFSQHLRSATRLSSIFSTKKNSCTPLLQFVTLYIIKFLKYKSKTSWFQRRVLAMTTQYYQSCVSQITSPLLINPKLQEIRQKIKWWTSLLFCVCKIALSNMWLPLAICQYDCQLYCVQWQYLLIMISFNSSPYKIISLRICYNLQFFSLPVWTAFKFKNTLFFTLHISIGHSFKKRLIC